MKKLISFLLLIAVAALMCGFQQSTMSRDYYIKKKKRVSNTGGAPVLTFGNIDAWVNMNGATGGAAITTTNLASGTVQGTTFSGVSLPTNAQLGNGTVPGADVPVATALTTGSDANGYYVNSLEIYNNGVSVTGASGDLGVYSNSSGAPSSLLCHTGSVTITVSSFNHYTFPITGCPALTASTEYWVAFISNSATLNLGNTHAACATSGQPLVNSNKGPTQGSAVLASSWGTGTTPTLCYNIWFNGNGQTATQAYTLNGTTAGMTVSSATAQLGGSLTIQLTGQTATATTASNGVTLADADNNTSWEATPIGSQVTGANITEITSTYYYTPGYTGGGLGSGNYMDVFSYYDGTGAANVTQMNGGAQCNGNLGMEIESASWGPGTHHSGTCVQMTQNHRYLITFQVNPVSGAGAYATYSSGGTVTGSANQYCTLSGTGFSGTVQLGATNSLASAVGFFYSTSGLLATAPTSATLGNGSATCSGTATFTSATLSGASAFSVYDPSNSYAQVGSQVTMAMNAGSSLAHLIMGNNENGAPTGGTSSTIDNVLLDWTCNKYPNFPHTSAGGSCP